MFSKLALISALPVALSFTNPIDGTQVTLPASSQGYVASCNTFAPTGSNNVTGSFGLWSMSKGATVARLQIQLTDDDGNGGAIPYTGSFKSHLHNALCDAPAYGGLHYKNLATVETIESNEVWIYGDQQGGAFSPAVEPGSYDSTGAAPFVVRTGEAFSWVVHKTNSDKWFCCPLSWSGGSATCSSWVPLAANPANKIPVSDSNSTIVGSITVDTDVPAIGSKLAISSTTLSNFGVGLYPIAYAQTGTCAAPGSKWKVDPNITTTTTLTAEPNEAWYHIHLNSTSKSATYGVGKNTSFTALPTDFKSIVVTGSASGGGSTFTDIACCNLDWLDLQLVPTDAPTTTASPGGTTTTKGAGVNGASTLTTSVAALFVGVLAFVGMW